MRIAALDLGTNSFHLLIAQVQPDGGFTALSSEKEMLRLGDAVSRQGGIPPDVAEQAVATIRRFRMLADAAECDETLACATSAIRLADNGAWLIDRIREETGVEVEVINGLREAQLIFNAVRASVLLEPAPALCFDLGGGSVEITVGDAGGLRWATSENVGVARLTADYVTSDPLSKADRKELRNYLETILAPIAAEVARYAPRMAVGSSGTLESIGRMVAARRTDDVPHSLNQLTFTREEFEPLHKELISTRASERRRIEGLEAKRVDLIPAGSMFLHTAMDLFDFDELTVSEWALREGMVLEAIRQHDPADWSEDPRAIRRSSVYGLARRCGYPEAHSQQVTRLALSLFDQTKELHVLGSEDRELLEYAAVLHDIGEHVAHEDHHKHAAYLVRYGQLRGFDPEEVHMIGALARGHRGGDPRPLDEFGASLGPRGDERLRILTAVLRLADGLDRSRSNAVDEVDVRVGPSLVLLRLRAAGDVELELWATRRKRALFEKVFDRELEVTAHPSGRAVLSTF